MLTSSKLRYNQCMAYTTSFHHGSEIARRHNIRDPKCTNKEQHIDPNGLHETWIDEPIKDAYERIFGEAVKEYNAKQKQPSRRIKSYLQKVRQNSKLHEAYEFIVQVGNKDNHPPADVSRTILKEYLDDFKRRNPTLDVIGAYFHADEIGNCPHAHIDYVPKGKRRKQGLKIQNNLSSALEELGYKTEWQEVEKDGKSYKKMNSAEMQFQRAESQRLAEICKAHGLEIENPNRKPEEYCTSKQLREARNVLLKAQKDAEITEARNRDIDAREKQVEKALPFAMYYQDAAKKTREYIAEFKNEKDGNKIKQIATRIIAGLQQKIRQFENLLRKTNLIDKTNIDSVVADFKKSDAKNLNEYLYQNEKQKHKDGLERMEQVKKHKEKSNVIFSRSER